MYFRVNFEVHSGYGGPFLSIPVRSGPFRLVNAPILGWVVSAYFGGTFLTDIRTPPLIFCNINETAHKDKFSVITCTSYSLDHQIALCTR